VKSQQGEVGEEEEEGKNGRKHLEGKKDERGQEKN
jgi:hypothetical protein